MTYFIQHYNTSLELPALATRSLLCKSDDKNKNERMKERSSEIFRINIIKWERIMAFSDVKLCIG
jgi:hypothetical protein